jgi:haloalkane dehalogenase
MEPMIPSWVDHQAYPFTHRFATLRRGRMHYVEEGQGPPFLFVHGTPTWSFEYRHLIRGLRPSFRCIAPDHLGFGLSERPRDLRYTPEEHSENLREFVDQLRLEDFTLVVHDYGGPFGLPLVLERPERVRRVVLLNTWLWSFADDPTMRRKARTAGGALGRFLYRRFNASLRLIAPSAYGDRSKLTRAIHRQYLAPFPDAWSREKVLWALARALLSSSDFYAGLWVKRAVFAAKPVLIVWGMKDTAFQPYVLNRWEQALPSAKVVRLEASGHWPHEEEPERVLEAIREFVASPIEHPDRSVPLSTHS